MAEEFLLYKIGKGDYHMSAVITKTRCTGTRDKYDIISDPAGTDIIGKPRCLLGQRGFPWRTGQDSNLRPTESESVALSS